MKLEKAWKIQYRIELFIRKRKEKFLSDVPNQEWKLPCMVMAVSGFVFILLTAMFGVTYNTMTGEASFHLAPGDDWSNPVVGKPGENTRTAVNPMSQYPWFCFLAMILGYFICIGMFTIAWLRYCKWRWMNVPEVLRYRERYVKRNDNGQTDRN